jgi:TRAP-type C4-dicarboxylate transport system substrate-binding protein
MRKIILAAAVTAGLVAGGAVAKAEEVHLLTTSIALPNTPASQMMHEWADRINAAGKGAINIDVRDGFALVNSRNFYERLTGDVIQISFGSLNYEVGKFPLCQVMGLPFVFDSGEEASAVFWRLYKSGMLDSEFDQVVPLFFMAFPQNSLHLAKAPAAPLEDLHGLRIIASGRIETRVIQELGGAPASIALSESYEALQRGTADGLIFPVGALPDFKLDEATHYHIIAALGGGPGGVWMAKSKYMSLPPDVRKILDENSGEAQSRVAGRVLDKREVEVPKALEVAKNQTVTTLTPEQSKRWTAAVAPVLQSWADGDKEHADAVYAKVRALAADYSREH